MALTIVPVYAALLAFIYVSLSLRVARMRGRLRVGLGTGGDASLERAIRIHGNFAEYVPLALLLLAFLELRGNPPWLLHGLCLALVLARLAHAVGLYKSGGASAYRVFGLSVTILVTLAAALGILRGAFAG